MSRFIWELLKKFQHFCICSYFVQFSLCTVRQQNSIGRIYRFIFRIEWSSAAALAYLYLLTTVFFAIIWLSLYFEKDTFSYLNGKKFPLTSSRQITFKHMAVPTSLVLSHFMLENMSVRILCLLNGQRWCWWRNHYVGDFFDILVFFSVY